MKTESPCGSVIPLNVLDILSSDAAQSLRDAHSLYYTDRVSLAYHSYQTLKACVTAEELNQVEQENPWITLLLKDMTDFKYVVSSLESDDTWKEAANSNDIRVLYRQHNQDPSNPDASAVHDIAVHADFYCDLSDLVAVLNENDLIPEILPMLDVRVKKLAQLGRFSQLISFYLGLIWPFSNRDVLVEAKGVDMLDKDTIVILAQQPPKTQDEWDFRYGEHVLIPEEVPNVQRMDLFPSGGIIRIMNTGHLIISGLFRVDPKLAVVPVAVINFLTRNLAHTGVEIVRRQLRQLRSSIFGPRVEQKSVFYNELNARFACSSETDQHIVDMVHYMLCVDAKHKDAEEEQNIKQWLINNTNIMDTSVGQELLHTIPQSAKCLVEDSSTSTTCANTNGPVETDTLSTLLSTYKLAYFLIRNPANICTFVDRQVLMIGEMHLRLADGFFGRNWANCYCLAHTNGVYIFKEKIYKKYLESTIKKIQDILTEIHPSQAIMYEYPDSVDTPLSSTIRANPLFVKLRDEEKKLVGCLRDIYSICSKNDKDGMYLTNDKVASMNACYNSEKEDDHWLHLLTDVKNTDAMLLYQYNALVTELNQDRNIFIRHYIHKYMDSTYIPTLPLPCDILHNNPRVDKKLLALLQYRVGNDIKTKTGTVQNDSNSNATKHDVLSDLVKFAGGPIYTQRLSSATYEAALAQDEKNMANTVVQDILVALHVLAQKYQLDNPNEDFTAATEKDVPPKFNEIANNIALSGTMIYVQHRHQVPMWKRIFANMMH